MLPIGILAFMPSQGELIILLVIGLLLFGRRLPEVGRTVGKTFMDFRRSLNEFKQQITEDESLHEVKSSVQDIKRAVDAPRIATDPKRLFTQLTDEALATPATPDAEIDSARDSGEPKADPGPSEKTS